MATPVFRYTASCLPPRDLGQNDLSRGWTAVFSQSCLRDSHLQPDLGNADPNLLPPPTKAFSAGSATKARLSQRGRWPLPSQPLTDISPPALCHAGLVMSAVSTLPGWEVFPFPGGVRRVKKRSLF